MMPYLLHELFGFFASSLFESDDGCRIRLVKTKKKEKHDFVSVLPPNVWKVDLEEIKKLLETKNPWFGNYVKVDKSNSTAMTQPNSTLNVDLERSLAFKHGLQMVHRLQEKYGANDSFNGKVFSLNKNVSEGSLTDLRILKVHRIISNLINFSGGKIDLEADPELSFLLTHKSTESQNKILIGTVNETSKSTLKTENYIKLKIEEIKTMSEYKLETNKLESIDDLVEAAVIFDMANVSLKKTVSISQDSEKSSCKGAMFVIYNYVRLNTLIAKFEDLVNKSVYTPLIDLESVDFSLLAQDEEWTLFLNFILYWPEVVEQSIIDIMNGQPKIHFLLKFLMDFSTTFSPYYRRTRILIDPRPHLIPLIHARIHLMLGLRQVVQNAFGLIGLTTRTYM